MYLDFNEYSEHSSLKLVLHIASSQQLLEPGINCMSLMFSIRIDDGVTQLHNRNGLVQYLTSRENDYSLSSRFIS